MNERGLQEAMVLLKKVSLLSFQESKSIKQEENWPTEHSSTSLLFYGMFSHALWVWNFGPADNQPPPVSSLPSELHSNRLWPRTGKFWLF